VKDLGRVAYDAWWATAEGVPDPPDVTYAEDREAWQAAAGAVAAEVVNPTAQDYDNAAEIIRLRGALAEAASHVEPVDQNSELAIARWQALAAGES